MREIKFRAWHKNTNRMLDFCEKGFDYLMSSFEPDADGDGMYYVEAGDSAGEDFILMQYTGLKDSKGVEIYEGDILKGDRNPYSKSSPVEHDFVLWRGIGWKRESYNGDMKVYPDLDYKITEVIGNIHENPELLETK